MVIDIVFFGNLVLGQSLESGKKEKLTLVSLGARGCYRLPNYTQNTMKSSINRGVSRFHIPDGTGMTSLLGNQVNGCSVRNSDPLIGRFEMSMVFACVVIDKAR